MTVESRASEPLTLSLQGDRIHHPARGIRGGRPGMRASVTRNGEPLNAKGRTLLHPGDHLVVRNAGGGGYGPPEERAPAALAADLEGGLRHRRKALSILRLSRTERLHVVPRALVDRLVVLEQAVLLAVGGRLGTGEAVERVLACNKHVGTVRGFRTEVRDRI